VTEENEKETKEDVPMTTLQRWGLRLMSLLAAVAAFQILFLGEISSVSTTPGSKYTFEGIEKFVFIFPSIVSYLFYLATTDDYVEDDTNEGED